MEKVLRKRSGRLVPVYAWAVEYSRAKSRARKLTGVCKDCSQPTKPGRGAARCPLCWEARCGY